MDSMPEAYVDILSQMVLDLGDIGDDAEFAPLLAVIHRGIVIMRNPNDFTIDTLNAFYQDLLNTAHAISGMEPIAEALAAMVGMDLDGS